MTRSFRSKLFLAFALVMLVAGPAAAQSTARVEGSVTDATGAALPGATVTATNQETNVARIAVTNEQGQYAIPSLTVGDYRVQGELSGFRPRTIPVTLTVGQVARIDLTLGLGVEETVVVTAEAPAIDKTTSQISTVITQELVEDLPLNGRNFTQLATLVPGVNRGIPGGNASGGGGGTDAETFRYSEFGGAGLSVNGVREQFNNYLIEGLDNNESLVNSIAYIPSPEAIREFSVITTTAPAEFGRAGGAIQNLVIKSGTNTLDGSVFYFVRPRSLAAKPKFAVDKPEFENEDFGAAVGGPLFRDRTFYFASYHGLRNSIPVEPGTYVSVPTAKMRNGDFSELLDPAVTGFSQPVIIYNPTTGVPFPGNIIPQNLINPVGRAYLNVFPLPTRAGVTNNYLTHRQKESTYDDFDIKFDHTFSPTDLLFFSGSQWDDKFSDPGRIPGYQAGFGAGTSEHNGYSLRTGETHVFSGDLVNELRVGYTDFHFAFLPVGFGADQNAAIGIPGPGGVTVANGISLIGGGPPFYGFHVEYLGDYGQYNIDQRTIQIADSVTWLRGNHTFKFGGSVMRREFAQQRTQVGKGFYRFRTEFGFQPGFSGYEVSDILVGTTIDTETGVPGYVPRNVIHWENAIFAQDDWHVLPNLTLNLGLRWDVFTPYYEEDDKMANFDPATGQLALPDEDGVPRGTIDTDKDNFGPRIGFNYLFDDKTTLRGAYGIFYALDRGGIDNQLTENPPAVVREYRGGNTPGAQVRISDPIPLPTPVDPNNPVLPAGTGIVYIPRDSENPEIQQWSLSVQRELFRNTSAMLAYVGSRGENLAARLNLARPSGGGFGRTIMYIGESSYDAIQATVRRAESNGLSFLASYTYGEARDNTPGLFPGFPSSGNPAPTDPNCGVIGEDCNLDFDEGRADYDPRHRFTFAGTWALPFARENAILGGWKLNAVYTLQSGTPFTAFSDYGRRADQIGDPNDGPKTTEEWFDTSAFRRPPDGAQGTAERNSVVGPGIRTLDLSLFKTFGLGNLGDIELRVEGFNVFNTPQYGQPAQYTGDPNFGKITSTRLNSERQVQLALRYLF